MTIIHHPADPRERSARVMLRQLVLPMKGSITGPDARAQYDEVLKNVPAAAGPTTPSHRSGRFRQR